jgi:fimbrial chaperone protein
MNQTMIRALNTALAVAALCAALPAAGSSFSVAPIRVELDRSHKTGVLTLHNEGDNPVVVQITAVSWQQHDGEERFEEAGEILVTPPVFELAGKGEQIVRIALRRDAEPGTELAYRLFFEEVPQARTPTFNGLNVALKIGLPIFVSALNPTRPDVDWQGEWQPDGTLVLSATNRGTEHVQVTNFDLTVGESAEPLHVAGSKYVLPGCRMTWTVTPPKDADRHAPLHLTGVGDHGTLDVPVALVTR